MYYIFNNGRPAPLPWRIRLPNGQTRTDPSQFTPELIAQAGYTPVEDPPIPGPGQYVDWDGANWVLLDKPTTNADENV